MRLLLALILIPVLTTCGLQDEYNLRDAAHKGDTPKVLRLIEANADVNATNSGGYTALHYAAENGHVGTVDELLKRKADINHKNYLGLTPLHHAADSLNDRVVLLLLNKKANPTSAIMTTVNAGGRRKDPRSLTIVKALLEHKACVNTPNIDGTPLDLAAYNKHQKMMPLLKQHGGKRSRHWPHE